MTIRHFISGENVGRVGPYLVQRCKSRVIHWDSHIDSERILQGSGYIWGKVSVCVVSSGGHSRLLNALGLDVPTGKIVREYAHESLLGIIAVLSPVMVEAIGMV